MRHYLIAWDMGSGVVSAHLSLATIAWMIGVIHIRSIRIWYVGNEMFPEELRPLINKQTHQVGLMNPHTGEMIEVAEYQLAQG